MNIDEKRFQECEWCSGSGDDGGGYNACPDCESTGLKGGRYAAEDMERDLHEHK